MARRGYPPEFRRRVVDLVEGGRKVSEVAADWFLRQVLGVVGNSLSYRSAFETRP